MDACVQSVKETLTQANMTGYDIVFSTDPVMCLDCGWLIAVSHCFKQAVE